jgi:predicted nucleic acid-binding protein
MRCAAANLRAVPPKRMLVDFVVGAHALLQADRLVTQDEDRYARDFPDLRLIAIP